MKRDPVEIVQIAVPVLIEVVAVCLFLGMIAVYAALACGA
jgi:hypothetical protein